MASAAASTDEHQLLHHHHHHQQQQQQQHNIIYHVPQHSRREKLRYPLEETSSFPTYYTQNPHHYYSSSQFIIDDTNNYTTQPFTLTLSSSSSSSAAAAAAAAHPAQLGPFTGYTTILSRSRFLEPARKLLEELFDVARAGGSVAQCADLSENFLMNHGIMDGQILGSDVGEHQWRKTRLISMLDEVHRKYKQYYQQVQTVTSLFESVPGLSSAAPYASADLKVMSKHFWCLKNAISEQLHNINKTAAKEEGFRLLNGGIGPHRMGNDLGALKQPHIWRPQRGLPERAVAVLRAWLFEHFLHPYPTDADKQMLAKQTGLTRNQVSNWFINARVRLWKPMVEEVHSLEVRQLHKITAADKNQDISDKPAQLVPSALSATSSIDQQLQDQHPKRPRDELTQMSNNIEEPYNLVYDGFSGQHLVEEVVDLKGNGSVSLTLGLHQNDGVCLTEPLPLSVVRRFGLGLEECNDAYVIGSFEGQGRNFEKEIGGHYLYDFVG